LLLFIRLGSTIIGQKEKPSLMMRGGGSTLGLMDGFFTMIGSVPVLPLMFGVSAANALAQDFWGGPHERNPRKDADLVKGGVADNIRGGR